MTGLFPDTEILSVISVVFLLKPGKKFRKINIPVNSTKSSGNCFWVGSPKKERKKKKKNLVSSKLLLPCCENQTDLLLWVICLTRCCFLRMFLWFPAVGCNSSYNFPNLVFLNVLSSQTLFSVSWLTFSKSASDRFLLACATHFSASVCRERKWE